MGTTEEDNSSVNKLHISRVPTTFSEDVVQRILAAKLGCDKECVSEVTLIYPREEEGQTKSKETTDEAEGDTGEAIDYKVHRGFGFVTLSTPELLEQALELQTIRGGLKPTSTKKHTMYLRPYHDQKASSKQEEGGEDGTVNICYLWTQNRCPYGENCKFEHSGPGGCQTSESTSTSKKSKKQKCFAYKKGKCKRGDDCPFSHDFVPSVTNKPTTTSTVTAEEPEKPVSQTPKSEKDCINWKTKGKCRKGDKCPYRHDESVQQLALAKLKKKDKSKKRLRDEDGEQHTNNKKQKQPLSVRVFGLNYDTKEQDVRDFFEGCGPIMEVTFPVFEDSGRSKGYCGVRFTSPKAVEKAIELDGQELFGRWLRIQAGKMYLKQWEGFHEQQRQQQQQQQQGEEGGEVDAES